MPPVSVSDVIRRSLADSSRSVGETESSQLRCPTSITRSRSRAAVPASGVPADAVAISCRWLPSCSVSVSWTDPRAWACSVAVMKSVPRRLITIQPRNCRGSQPPSAKP
ncbi:hypothetical protein GCM10018962_38650 [Dactylosporangium matsuzakiense]